MADNYNPLFKDLKHLKDLNNYQEKITQVLSYIEANLATKHQLEDLAGMVYLSKYHFHRMISAYLNESLGAYIIRLRMETAAKLLIYSKQTISEIAYRIGYETPAAFTKGFKKAFQISPSAYRVNKEGVYPILKPQVDLKAFELTKMVRYIPKKMVLFQQAKGGYEFKALSQTWTTFLEKAYQHQLVDKQTTYFGISRDDPNITPNHKVRYDACISKPMNQAIPDSFFNEQAIGGGKYLCVRYKGSYEYLGAVYQQIFRQLILENKYVLRDALIFEEYLNRADFSNPSELLTEIHIPIE